MYRSHFGRVNPISIDSQKFIYVIDDNNAIGDRPMSRSLARIQTQDAIAIFNQHCSLFAIGDLPDLALLPV